MADEPLPAREREYRRSVRNQARRRLRSPLEAAAEHNDDVAHGLVRSDGPLTLGELARLDTQLGIVHKYKKKQSELEREEAESRVRVAHSWMALVYRAVACGLLIAGFVVAVDSGVTPATILRSFQHSTPSYDNGTTSGSRYAHE